jgi:hypothetical protein
MTKRASTLAMLAGCAASAHAGFGNDVIVTEVFFNPSGDEAETEWVELTNVGLVPVDVSDWRLADEDNNSPSDPLGSGAIYDPMSASIIPGAVDQGEAGCDFANESCSVVNSLVLQPGESIIVMSSWEYPQAFNQLPGSGSYRDGRANTIPDFIASWGFDTDDDGVGDAVDYRIVLLLNTITIANTASDVNEVLHLIDGSANVVNWPNYEVGRGANQWPFSSNGRSIYLQPNFFTSAPPPFPANGALGAIDQASVLPGEAWGLSTEGVDRGIAGRLVESIDADSEEVFTLYGEGDVASPGTVPTVAESFTDFNGNAQDDAIDIILGVSQDCNRNRIPDESEPDGNNNGVPDDCEIQLDQELDCDGNGILDAFDIANNAALDGNGDGVLDLCQGVPGFAEITITEIMFNPSGSEREWIELYNSGTETVNLEGYFFQDLDQPVSDGAEPPFPAFTLAPGEIAVLGDPSLEDWEAGWGPVTGSQYIPVGGISLANNADLANEVRSLLAPVAVGKDMTVDVRVDVANYQGTTSNGVPQGGWPGDDGRGSFYHYNPAGQGINTTANNRGENWNLSIRGLDGARRANNTGFFNGLDHGSPGVVNTGAPERAVGSVVISEIMFATNSEDPNGPAFPDADPGFDEWVEIVNVSGAPVDVSGWYLEDEDGATTAFPVGTVLQADEVAVVFGADRAGAQLVNYNSVQEFYDAWGCGYQAIPVESWYTDLLQPGLDRLGDSGEGGTATDPSTGREILQLRDASDNPIDVVNYDNDGFVWPLVPQNANPGIDHLAIFLFNTNDLNEEDNDNGLNWGSVPSGFFGARSSVQTTLFNGRMAGSPGFVEGLSAPLDPGACLSDELCRPDLNRDGVVDLADITAFVTAFTDGGNAADFAGDFGVLDLADITTFVTLFSAGCP